MSQPSTVPITDQHRREVAQSYERGWDDAVDMAAEVIRGATDVRAALIRLSVLGRQAPGMQPKATEPGT